MHIFDLDESIIGRPVRPEMSLHSVTCRFAAGGTTIVNDPIFIMILFCFILASFVVFIWKLWSWHENCNIEISAWMDHIVICYWYDHFAIAWIWCCFVSSPLVNLFYEIWKESVMCILLPSLPLCMLSLPYILRKLYPLFDVIIKICCNCLHRF